MTGREPFVFCLWRVAFWLFGVLFETGEHNAPHWAVACVYGPGAVASIDLKALAAGSSFLLWLFCVPVITDE